MLANLLSFSRVPLAFLMIDPQWRLLAVILACISDMIDGACARLFKTQSNFGAYLDPICDKFFVLFGLGIFLYEGKMMGLQAFSFLSRECALGLFTLLVIYMGQFKTYIVRAIITGKVITSLQFMTFFLLALNFPFPLYLEVVFFVLGFVSFLELTFRDKLLIPKK